MSAHALPQCDRFDVEATSLAGLWLVRLRQHRDERGSFARLYCANEFSALGLNRPLSQINHSHSLLKGTLRGLHFQHPPHAEHKLVHCLAGAVLDVVVDLRATSPTLLQWVAIELDATRRASLLIPPGCAHGFQTLEDDTDLLYMHSLPHAPAFEGGLGFDEPLLRGGGITLPLPVSARSARDSQWPRLAADFSGLTP
jgi:dTDP-4-dehydrorhamnose 3,5-epimerase